MAVTAANDRAAACTAASRKVAVHDPSILKPRINAKGKQKTNHNGTTNTTTSNTTYPFTEKELKKS